MNAIRRGYIYLAGLISLQVVTWAVIFLLRNLLGEAPDRSNLAWQLAVIVIALPIFLGHWLWAERLARREEEEREALLRRLYLFANLALFLGPLLTQLFYLSDTLLQLAAGVDLRGFSVAETQTTILLDSVLAAAVLLPLIAYHWVVLRRDRGSVVETGRLAVVQRLYQWGFTAAGLTMTAIALTELLGWLMRQLEGGVTPGTGGEIIPEITRTLVGLPAWLLFWLWGQRRFAADTAGEQASALRKLYLYLVVAVGLFMAVINAALLWDSILQRLLGLETFGELSDVLPLMVTGAILWGYHVSVLKGDAQVARFVAEQMTIRQIYEYLIAAAGLLATLAGVGGLISVLIRSLAGDVVDRTEITAFLAALTAGLPVWLIPWWRIQGRFGPIEEAETSEAESGSLVRRVYLYGFVLLATLTVLASGIFLVYQGFLLLFNLEDFDLTGVELGLAAAYGLLGLGIWLYHGRLLRRDGRLLDAARAAALSGVTVAVIDTEGGDGALSGRVTAAVHRLLPAVHVLTVGYAPPAEGAEDGALVALATADIIIGPWNMAAERSAENGDPRRAAVDAAVAASPARKILMPTARPGWVWAGVDEPGDDALVIDAARLAQQMALSAEGIRSRRWGVGRVIAVIIGVFFLVTIILPIIGSLIGLLF